MNRTLLVAAVVLSGCGVVEGELLPDGGLAPKTPGDGGVQQQPAPTVPRVPYVCQLGDAGDLAARYYELQAKIGAMASACAGDLDALPSHCEAARASAAFASAHKAIAANRIRFDAATLALCETAIAGFDPVAKCWGAAPTVDAIAGLHAVCDKARVGLVAANGLCSVTSECASGMCASVNGCGRCGAYRKLGESCSTFSCQAGLVCSGSATSPLTCKAGSAPAPGTAGTACTATRPCASGLSCLGNVCRPPAAAAAGASCEAAQQDGISSNGCVGRQICAGLGVDKSGGITARGVCTVPARLGEPCVLYPGEGFHPISGSCFSSLICDPAAKKCRPRPDVGETCDDDERYCQWGLLCSAADRVCHVPPTNGERCVNDRCAPPFLCDRTTDTCQPLPGLGAKCIRGECERGLYCTAAANCALLPKLGAACTSVCEADAFCSSGVCRAPLPAGSACTANFQCQNLCDPTTSKCTAAAVVTCSP